MQVCATMKKQKTRRFRKCRKAYRYRKPDLKAGDILLSVNGEDVTKLSLNDTIQKIKGKEGKKSELVVCEEMEKRQRRKLR